MTKANFASFFPQEYITNLFHPHITLMTRDLSKKMYSKAFPALEKMQFDYVMTIDKFCLFKHDGKKWNSICEVILAS